VDDVTDTKVPAFPNVLIIVTDAAVLVDGEVVDRGSAGDPDSSVAIHLGVHAAARRVAQRLGRPVRATLRADGTERRIIIEPDGSVTDAEEPRRTPASPVVSVAAPGARALPVPRPVRRPVRAVFLVDRTRLGMVTAYAALGAVLVGGLLVEASSGEDPRPAAASAPGDVSVQDAPVVPQPVLEATELDRLPGISAVAADSAAGGFSLKVTTNRAVQMKVLASPASGDGGSRLWTLRTSGPATRTLDIDDLDAGSYTWVVRSPGEPARTGRVVVPPDPGPPVVTEDPDDVQPAPDPTPPPADDSNGGGGDGGGNGGGGDAPSAGLPGPVDPDEPTAP
jgi:hypothetical protein